MLSVIMLRVVMPRVVSPCLATNSFKSMSLLFYNLH